jgi:hypothetical protein
MKRGFLVLGMAGLLSFLTLSPVFADYNPDSVVGTQLNDSRLLSYCNRQTAYSTGVSDARKGLARKGDFAEVCRVDRSLLNGAYNSGYNYGLVNQSGLVVNEPAPYHPEVQNQLPSSYVQPFTRTVTVVTNPNVPPAGAYVTNTPGGVVGGTGRVVGGGQATLTTGQVAGVGSAGTTSVTASGVTVPGTPSDVGSTGVETVPSNPLQGDRTNGVPKAYGYSTPSNPAEMNVPSGELARPTPQHGLRSLVDISPNATPKCISTPTGEACGYNCVNSMNNVRCARSPDQICRSNELGLIACGYNCISTTKTVRCALTPTDLCVADNNGNVFCGLNCRVERNAIGVCDIERYMPN